MNEACASFIFRKSHKTTPPNSQVVDGYPGSCLACHKTQTNYFENGEILSSRSLVQWNDSKVSITVSFSGKSSFLPPEAQKKCRQINTTLTNTGNSNMATQTGSTYISESMTDNVKIPTANLGFSTSTS